MELASCHTCGAENFEVGPRFLEKFMHPHHFGGTLSVRQSSKAK